MSAPKQERLSENDSTATPINVGEGQIEFSTDRPLRIHRLTGYTAIFFHGKDTDNKAILTGCHVSPRGYPDIVHKATLEAIKAGTIERVEVYTPLDEYRVMAEAVIRPSAKKRVGVAPDITGDNYPWNPDIEEEWEYIGYVGGTEDAKRIYRCRGVLESISEGDEPIL